MRWIQLLIIALWFACANPALAATLTLTWTDNSTNEAGFTVERCQGASCSTFTQIGQTAANIVTYADPNLPASTTFCYRVKAFNATDQSAYSNTACATTPAPPPVNAITTNLTNGQVLVGAIIWTATNAPGTAVPTKIDFSIDGTVKWTETSPLWQYGGDPNGTLDTKTLPNGSHVLMTTATYADNTTASVQVTVTVNNPVPPAPPSNLSITISMATNSGVKVASSPPGIACPPTCVRIFPVTTPVTLTGTPVQGTRFKGFTVKTNPIP